MRAHQTLSKNRPETINLEFSVLRLEDEFPGLLPFKRGERGRQHFIKLTRDDEDSYLYVGSNSALRSEIQQALMRLLNDGWTPEGEVYLDFDGLGDAGYESSYVSERIQLEIGRALLPLLDPQNGAPLLDHIENLRAELVQLLGLPLPQIRVIDNLNLDENRYLLKIKSAPVFSSELFLERLFAIGSPQQLDSLEGWTTHDPVLATRAKWVEADNKEKAETAGCTLLGPLSLMMHHLRSLVAQSAADLLGLQDTFDLVDRLAVSHPVVAEPFLDNRKALRYVQEVLRELLSEGLPIKDLVTIGEVAGACYDSDTPPTTAVEECRKALHFQLCSRLVDEEGQLVGLALGPDWEQELQTLAGDQDMTHQALEQRGQNLVVEVKKKLDEVSPQRVVALFTDPGTRRIARQVLEKSIPRLAVVATDELAPSIKVLVAGSVTRDENVAADSVEATGEQDGARFPFFGGKKES
jgi:flagellar biosynthesis protein FlhA